MSLLSHDRYQYDSLILSKETWAYPRRHLQQLLWCVVSVRLNSPEVEERKLCPLRYYANCVSTTLTVLILHNVESVYFFYSNPAFQMQTSRCLLMKLYFNCKPITEILIGVCQKFQGRYFLTDRHDLRFVFSLYALAAKTLQKLYIMWAR